MQYLRRSSGLQRVPHISKEEQNKTRANAVAEHLPIGYLNERLRLASEDEIAIANINLKKHAEEERKSRKVLQSVENVVGGAVAIHVTKPKAPGKRKRPE